jgi:Ribonuclease G/E
MGDIFVDLGFAKQFGLSESDFKGKSPKEQEKTLDDAYTAFKKKKMLEVSKQYIDAGVAIIPKFKEVLSKPNSMYVKKVGQKKSATLVKTVGYIPEKDEIVVYMPETDKTYRIRSEDTILTTEDLEKHREAGQRKKSKADGSKSKTKPKT